MNIQISNDGCGAAASIQSHGWILACDRRGVFVRRRSANIGEIFDAAGEQESMVLVDAVGAEAAHAIRNATARAAHCSRPIMLPRLTAGSRRGIFDVAVHVACEEIVIEFERGGLNLPQSPLDLARVMIDRVSMPDEPERLLAKAAQLLAASLHFDLVVVARANGKPLISVGGNNEASASALGRLIDGFAIAGHIRAVHDVSAAPAPILTQTDRTGPLDLTRAQLRGASEAERRALRDLGAAASLLLPILDNGALWGFFVGLNRTAGLPSMESRAVAELFAEFFSMRLMAPFRRKQQRPVPIGLLAQAALASSSA